MQWLASTSREKVSAKHVYYLHIDWQNTTLVWDNETHTNRHLNWKVFNQEVFQ